MSDDQRSVAELDETRMPFGDHLEELRKRLILGIAGLAIGTIVSLVFAKRILAFIITPVLIVLEAHGETPQLLALMPHGPFIIYLKVGFLSGLVISTPWVMHQIWLFVCTGLYPRERTFVRRFAPVSVGLFATGVLFMFYIVLPVVLNFFVTFNQGFDLPNLRPNRFQSLLLGTDDKPAEPVKLPPGPKVPIVDRDPSDPEVGSIWFNSTTSSLNFQTPDGPKATPLKSVTSTRAVASQYGLSFFVSLVFALTLAFGLAFELPVLVVFLAATGIVSTAEMARARRYVMFGIVVAAAILTPPDVISQVLLALPMFILFESGLAVGRVFERRHQESA